jgi:hypothetical protein
MNKIVFECIKEDGETFTVLLESTNQAIFGMVSATVAAYLQSGVEVISASRVEEMGVDLDLHATPAQRTARKSWFSRMKPRFGFRPMWAIEKAAAFGGLALAVIGFDHGFSVASMGSNISRLLPAIGHMIHLA